jgi:hypothetical protein
MTELPITRMTLYKHGVGFFERRAEFDGEEVTLSFPVEAMNDILKSLTAIDWGSGQVLGVDYATPQSRAERLAGSSIHLNDDRSLRDLLISLRGRRVRLLLDQSEELVGVLVGLDEVKAEQPLATSLVSVLLDQTAQVQAVALARVQGVEILDERGAADLRFFLQVSLTQENYRQVTIRLTPGAHELSVSYIAPAPTWRVSYRLVADAQAEGGPQALLLGWGIFDNRLEETLQGIELSLIAGMPISFVYDLYTPFLPERPEIAEESRVAPGPVDFAGSVMDEAKPAPAPAMAERSMMAMAPMAAAAPKARRIETAALRDAAPVSTTGAALGELFQYNITTPVTVGRGQSAMVPIVSADLSYRKELLYNRQKLPTHPVASLRLENKTGLTLERGPVTVIESGEYVGEAVLPFTADDAEFIIPYAVELSVRVREQAGSSREIRGLRLSGAYLLIEEWDVRWTEYQLNNSAAKAMTVLVEQMRATQYELFETAAPKEKTDEAWRFEVNVPARGEAILRVQTRQLITRREELQRQSYAGLQRYLRQGLLDRSTHDRIAQLLGLWEQINNHQQRLQAIEQERQKVYRAQQQIQGNMGALANTGKEGALRARYVDQLEAGEETLRALAEEETQRQTEIKRLEQEIESRLRAWNKDA